MVGGGSAPSPAVADAIVTIVGSRGTSCTGTLIARDIILTAAHCVAPGTSYKMVDYKSQPPRLLDIKRAAAHPQFRMQSLLAHRATADVALLQLAAPSPRDSGNSRRRADAGDCRPATHGCWHGCRGARRWPQRRRGARREPERHRTGPAHCRSAWSIPQPTTRARASAPAPAIPARRRFSISSGGSAVIGVVSWSTARTTPRAAAASPASRRSRSTATGF